MEWARKLLLIKPSRSLSPHPPTTFYKAKKTAAKAAVLGGGLIISVIAIPVQAAHSIVPALPGRPAARLAPCSVLRFPRQSLHQ